jgi:hypothetical protein
LYDQVNDPTTATTPSLLSSTALSSTGGPMQKMIPEPEATLAKLLDKYMRFRAKHEGMAYEMTPEDYYPLMCIGVHDFFGVHVTDDGLVSDEQRPDLFALWNSRTRRRSASHSGIMNTESKGMP